MTDRQTMNVFNARMKALAEAIQAQVSNLDLLFKYLNVEIKDRTVIKSGDKVTSKDKK